MSLRTEYKPGEFCWVDLMAHDMDAAAAFYGSLLGWHAEPQETDGGYPYTMFRLDGKSVAGMGQMGEEMKSQGAPPIWNNYVSVADLSSVVERAAQLGGSAMMQPMQVMEAGHMAIIADPGGAMLSLWQPNQHFGAERVNEVGCCCWNELATRDMDSAKTFYGELFGWTYEKNDASPSEYYIIKHQDRMAGGMIKMDENWGEMPPTWGVYFTVADVDASCETLRGLGGSVMVEPFEAPPAGKIAVVGDANGGAFNLIQLFGEPD